MFANDTLIAEGGQIGQSAQSVQPERNTSLASYTPTSNVTYLIIHVSNFHDTHGGGSLIHSPLAIIAPFMRRISSHICATLS